jgi:hypothetical protein
VVVLAVVAVLVFVVIKPFGGDKKLSHTAVEKFISGNKELGSPSGVTCNGGSDFTMKKNGDTFTCTASGGKTFTVTIKDKGDGKYTVG